MSNGKKNEGATTNLVVAFLAICHDKLLIITL